ncbi:MAG: carbonic anhydrase, partial [Pseudomonadota bacterium]
AAIEYAVTALLVSNVVVLGHSSCGGVKGCHDMCQGKAEDLEAETSFVGRWMDLLRPKYEVVKDINDEANRLEALEKECVLTSLENLMTFPFVAERVENERLSLHGLWHQIASGGLEVYDPAQKGFVPL